MNPARFRGPWSWVRSGVTLLALTALGVGALVKDYPIIGYLCLGAAAAYLALSIVLTVAVHRLPVSLAPVTPAYLRRRARMLAVTQGGGFAVAGIILLSGWAVGDDRLRLVLGCGMFALAVLVSIAIHFRVRSAIRKHEASVVTDAPEAPR